MRKNTIKDLMIEAIEITSTLAPEKLELRNVMGWEMSKDDENNIKDIDFRLEWACQEEECYYYCVIRLSNKEESETLFEIRKEFQKE